MAGPPDLAPARAIAAPAMLGTWTIEREVLDRVAGQRGTFTGELTVAPLAGGFSWQEAGAFSWAGQTRPAGRQLALAQLDGQWWLTFADGRPFHPWQFDVELIHPCRADVYRGELRLSARDEVTVSWEVTGPAKNQRIVSTLRRCR